VYDDGTMTPEEFRDYQNVKIWNFFLIIVFLAVGVWMIDYLEDYVGLPSSISIFDFFILALATFRLIRLISYDSIFKFVHEFFMRRTISVDAHGNRRITYTQEPSGLKRAVSILLGCLWCTGVWVALFSTFIYFAIPQSWVVFFALAIAGLAGVFQIFANLIGWGAEHKKMEAQGEKKSDATSATCGM